MKIQYLSPSHVARKFRVHKQQVNRWIAEARIPYEVVAGKRLIRAAGLKRPKAKKRGPRPDAAKVAS